MGQRDEYAALGVAGMQAKHATGFCSYMPLLRAACHALQPDVVVEWGPGYSTALLHAESNAAILSIEHDPAWVARVRREYEGDRVTVRHGCIDRKGKRTPYIMAPLLALEPGSVDLAFVDGRHRADCLLAASIILQPHGVAILHDAQVAAYRTGASRYATCIVTEAAPDDAGQPPHATQTAIFDLDGEAADRVMRACYGQPPIP